MNWQFPWYAVLLIAAAGLAVMSASVAWRRPTVPGRTSFVLLMLAVAAWGVFSALEAASPALADKITWSKLQYLGIANVAPLWLAYVQQSTRQGRWLTWRKIALLWLIPALTLVLVAANEWHGLIWSQVAPGIAPIGFAVYTHGPWFWVVVAYSYALLLAASALLVRSALRSAPVYRRQSVALLVGAATPWIGNAVYQTGLSPVPGLDLTPFAFAISGLVLVVSIFKLRLFDIVPMARDALVESMSDGVIVLDEQDRVVDLNPAAADFLDLSAAAVVGRDAMACFAAHPLLLSHLRGAADQPFMSLRPRRARAERFIDARVSALRDRRGRTSGRLVVLRDITERKLAEEVLAWESRCNTALAELSRSLISQATPEDIADLVLEYAKRLTDSPYGFVGHIDPRSGAAVISTLTRDIWSQCQVADKSFVFNAFRGLWGWVLSNRQPLLTNAPGADARSTGTPAGHIPIRRFLSAPALVDGELLGSIALANAGRDYTDRDLTAVTRLADLYGFTLHRRQTDEALRESQDRRALIFNCASDAMFLMEVEPEDVFRCVSVNQAYLLSTGFIEAQVIGMPPEGILPAAAAEHARSRYREAIRAGHSIRYEEDVELPTRHVIVETTLTPIFDHAGRCTHLLGASREITERKQAEEALRASEERFRTLIYASPDGICVSTPDGVLTYTSQRALEMFGYENMSEVNGRSLLEFIAPEHHARVRERLQWLARGDRLGPAEYVGIRKDGSRFAQESNPAVLRDVSGRPASFLFVIRDTTKRKRAEEELTRAKLASEVAAEAAQAANRAKTIFLANVSHEIRTPMNAILGFAQLMARDGTLAPAHHESVRAIEQNGQLLMSLINDILEMSRGETGRLVLQPRTFDLRGLLQRLGDMFEQQAAGKSMRARLEVDAEVPRYVRADEGKLRQALVNLVGHALRRGSGGEIIIRVACDPAAPGETLRRARFAILGGGAPFSDDELASVFEPFSGDAGLGLALSRQHLQLMDGRLAIRSAPPAGNVYEFDVQLETAGPEAETLASVQGAEDAPRQSAGPPAFFGSVPPGWCQQLAQAAELGDFDRATLLAGEVRPVAAGLADRIVEMAYNFDQTALLRLARQAQAEGEGKT
jgi:PAS domain S-box-containing protein